MATEAQIAANRANAQHSTGPKSLEGKAISRQNALRHGLRAKHVVAIDERGDDFAAYHQELIKALEPQDAFEAALVRRLTLLSWRLDRVARLEAARLNRESAGNYGAALAKDNVWPHIMPELARYESALDRAFKRTLGLLERRQAMRGRVSGPAGGAAPPRVLALGAAAAARIVILPNEANPPPAGGPNPTEI